MKQRLPRVNTPTHGSASHTHGRSRYRGRVGVLAFVCLIATPGVLLPEAAQGGNRPVRATARSPAAAPGFTIRLAGRLAPELAGTQIVSFAQVRRRFGRPALVARRAGTAAACALSWPVLGLVIDFSDGTSGSCATQKLGSWVEITATARRWHTRAGLYVADSEQRVHRLYPDTRSLDFLGYGPAWQLETGGPLCDGGPPLSLAALIRDHHVHALAILRISACG